MATSRQAIIAGNWKMHKTIDEGVAFINQLSGAIGKGKQPVYLAVPFTSIRPCSEAAKNTSILIGAQNMNDASEGAFTGEIAAKMLVDAGAKFVILGHSERRQLFKEDNALINRKMKKALEEDLQPILCIGETLEERKAEKQKEVIQTQLEESLDGLDEQAINSIFIAYEPVWAIGTGETASPKQAQEMHAFIRQFLSEKWGKKTADSLSLLYGGSVNTENAATLLKESDIDGLLVGGASLKEESFCQIIQSDILVGVK